jgi:hypothetical protein
VCASLRQSAAGRGLSLERSLRSPECVANKMFNCATRFYPEITSMQPFVEYPAAIWSSRLAALTRWSPIGFGNDRCWLKETDGAVSESYIGLLAYGQR